VAVAAPDSAPPIAAGEEIIKWWKQKGRDPREKLLVFSDGMDVGSIEETYHHFAGRVRISFGWGTNLTNDLGYEALQIVIKMTRCNGQPVAKISDEPSKAMDYDPSYVAYLREVFEVPEAATTGGDGLDAD